MGFYVVKQGELARVVNGKAWFTILKGKGPSLIESKKEAEAIARRSKKWQPEYEYEVIAESESEALMAEWKAYRDIYFQPLKEESKKEEPVVVHTGMNIKIGPPVDDLWIDSTSSPPGKSKDNDDPWMIDDDEIPF